MSNGTLTAPAPVAPTASGCITGEPCTLGCGLFCALEPVDTAGISPCRNCNTSAGECFANGPCCPRCDH